VKLKHDIMKITETNDLYALYLHVQITTDHFYICYSDFGVFMFITKLTLTIAVGYKYTII